MMNLQLIDDLARRLSALLPAGMSEARTDLERNFRAALQAGLQRLDLVTREEFEVQRAVLLRTREKLEALERACAAHMPARPPEGRSETGGEGLDHVAGPGT